MNEPTPLSIYIHIPFCRRKCLYCDFLSFPAAEDEMSHYVNLLLREIEQQADRYVSHKVISIFFGGGTPSFLNAEDIAAILCKLKDRFDIAKDAEITIEVNPDTVTRDKMERYPEAGINRLSIGLQTADDEELKTLGRLHDYAAFCKAYELARNAGFKNINVDLMSAIPGQSAASYRATLEKVTAYAPEHISAYSLILEEGTWFYDNRDRLQLATEEEDRQLYEMTKQFLESCGYHRYEISNYAKDGYECIHNKVYWQRGDYVGFGLGAASMVGDVRWNNCDDMEVYEKALLSAQNGLTCQRNLHSLTKQEQMEEFMFLGLRLTEGVKKADFFKKFALPIEEVYGETLKKLRKDGLISEGDPIRLTPYGTDISNYVMAKFLF